MSRQKNSDLSPSALEFDSNPAVMARLGEFSELGVFTIDQRAHLLSWSRGAEKITGYSREDMKGQAWRQVFEGAVAPGRSALSELWNSEQPDFELALRECRIVARNSSEIRLVLTGRRIQDSDTGEQGAMLFFVDLSEFLSLRSAATLPEDPAGLSELIGSSQSMKEVFRRIRLAADSDVTTCVTGETGTGKELAARAIHQLSSRRAKPFVAVNCSAIPETLLESELFGHLKGAFTGATKDRTGVFEAAQGGTLFLDEIGDVSPILQLKLLRCLQEREIRRVGANTSVPIDVRLLTATNRDLSDLLETGAIREDFYYRIRVFDICMPPLRERGEDILSLARHFLVGAAGKRGSHPQEISVDAVNCLNAYPWPGNVRELQNAIEHALVLQKSGVIDSADFPEHVQRFVVRTPRGVGSPSADDNEETERLRILAALDAHQWNRTRAAESLGISRVTLWKKIRRFRLDEGVFKRATKNEIPRP